MPVPPTPSPFFSSPSSAVRFFAFFRLHDSSFRPWKSASALVLAMGLGVGAASAAEDYVSYVNVLQGTDSSHDVSTGNTIPMIARPFGMTDWTIQTREDRWFFDPKQKVIQGVRATHQPSPWMGDYGQFTVLASAEGGPGMEGDVSAQTRQSNFEALKLSPDKLSLTLKPSDVKLEMTATGRSALYRFTFPAGKAGRVMIEGAAESGVEIDRGKDVVTGFTRSNNGGVPKNFAMYYAATFSAPTKRVQISEQGHIKNQKTKVEGGNSGVVIDFAPSKDGKPLVVEMRIGTSFISAQQAAWNAESEIGKRNLDAVSAESRGIWNRALGKIEIEATPREMRTFYSCFYRAQLFPREFFEFDRAGKPIHYSPYDGKVHPGILYTDNGFWDTYRTFYAFLAIVDPERLSQILQGWVQAYREGGWFPQWPSPGYRACMIGSHSDAVIADAIVKKIPGFDYREAFDGMLKHADMDPEGDPGYGRPGISGYLKRGYVFNGEAHASASAALDYAYDDFCIAQVARALGETKLAEKYEKRALNYRNNYDEKTDFMRGRNEDGSFVEPFDEYFWGGPYVEGGPWQSTWSVQHDPAGLIKLMGGPAAFAKKLDDMFERPGTYHTGKGGYENVIHEMVEMARLPFGQYAHSNQTAHHIPYLYLAAGQPGKTQHWVRRVLDEAYSPDAFSGDEDNGEMSAWYILSALGIYPLCPGRPEYVIGSPMVRSATVHLPGGKTLKIEASDNAPGRDYVKSLLVNGQPYDKLWISYFDLMEGPTMKFDMTREPSGETKSWRPDQLPPSLSPYENLQNPSPNPTGANSGNAPPLALNDNP